MNERIRELAHEAGLPTYNPTGIPTKLEKFAELIVRECAAIAKSVGDRRANEDMIFAADLAAFHISKHFGVE